MTDAKKSKILTAARAVFLRYGFKRVNMHDIAEAAGVSRPALYLLFKNKEEIFKGVFQQWVDATIAEIEEAMAASATPRGKLDRAFDIWSVRPFTMVMSSPEAKELIECSFGFAQASSAEGYRKFEATIVPVIASFQNLRATKAVVSPERTAHVLAGASRGFKQTATTPDELYGLINDLLTLVFPENGLQNATRV